jgi:hypothetical protein
MGYSLVLRDRMGYALISSYRIGYKGTFFKSDRIHIDIE